MPAFLITILNILGAAATAAPVIEQMLAGIGTYLSQAFKDIFGVSASQELANILTHAENIIGVVENDAPAVSAFISNTYRSLEDLLAKEPWLGNLLYSTHLVQQASPKPLSRGVLNKINEAAHATKNAKPAKK